jgi:inner membrane protein
MEGKTHSYVALISVGAIAITNFPQMDLGFMSVFPLIGLPAAVIGGLAADVDKQGTTMGQRHPWISKLFRTHRGITHTPIVCVGLLGLLSLFSGDVFVLQVIASVLFGFVAGYWSHVYIDVYNGAGIPHLWPLVWKRMHMMSVVTGTFEEKMYLFVFAILAAVHIICTYAHLTL